MPELFLNRFQIVEIGSLNPVQKGIVEEMIASHINIGNKTNLKKNLEPSGTQNGFCLMDGNVPFGFVHADSSARGSHGKILKIDYAVCPISKSKKDFVRAGMSRGVDPMHELFKTAVRWGTERNCMELVAAEPVSVSGSRWIRRMVSQEYLSPKSMLIQRDRINANFEESAIEPKRKKIVSLRKRIGR